VNKRPGPLAIIGIPALIMLVWSLSDRGPRTTVQEPRQERSQADTSKPNQSPLEKCIAFLNVMQLSGANMHELIGTDDTILGRARWCEANGYPMAGDRKAGSGTRDRAR